MSYTPMSDLGQQGLFDITRTLLQQPDLASLCEALSQLVKRSALADNAARRQKGKDKKGIREETETQGEKTRKRGG